MLSPPETRQAVIGGSDAGIAIIRRMHYAMAVAELPDFWAGRVSAFQFRRRASHRERPGS